ncbi:MAG: LytR/AlgR family response regulator transcription factor, partial [Caldimonas sp.]
MKLFLVEDEAPARERLIETIARVEPDARIAGVAASVREAAAWLAANPSPDLMLLDVQLADGLSFELFSEHVVTCPAIFATAYDEFVLEAFKA